MDSWMQNSSHFSFQLEAQHGEARAGTIQTPHGVIQTPIFMPVGTQATVKALDTEDIERTKAQIILANTYHLYLRPGLDVIEKAGGVHEFMHWNGPLLTDSGGFQVFSLGLQQELRKNGKKQTKISDNGVTFISHLDGSEHLFTPEKAIEIQRVLGPDIMMAFDECTPDTASLAYTREALDRTTAWAKRCVAYWNEKERMSAYGKYQALFGIIQGAMHKDLRRESAEQITSMGFDGIAVGGETVGYNMEGTKEVMGWLSDLLPKEKPRYAMGLGSNPQDVIDAVRVGFDMFDCVAPTRMARNGALYVGILEGTNDPSSWKFTSEYEKGRLQIGNAANEFDQRPIMEGCDCETCRLGYSRAYLRHLFHTKELTYYRLASIHNVRFMIRLTENLRALLLGGIAN